MLDALDYFYEDEDYKYYIPTMPNFIIYEGEQITLGEAINRRIITIQDVKKNCGYSTEAK